MQELGRGNNLKLEVNVNIRRILRCLKRNMKNVNANLETGT